jgi:hypothetical protein
VEDCGAEEQQHDGDESSQGHFLHVPAQRGIGREFSAGASVTDCWRLACDLLL